MKSNGKFSLAKKNPGAYFNDGDAVIWAQFCEGEAEAIPPKFIEAIRAACNAFFSVYAPKEWIGEESADGGHTEHAAFPGPQSDEQERLTTEHFKSGIPTNEELDSLENSIDGQMYCSNDVLILIAEVRRLRTNARTQEPR